MRYIISLEWVDVLSVRMSSLHVRAWLLVKPKKASFEPTTQIDRLTQIVFQKPVLRLQLLARLHRMLDRAQRLQRLQQQTTHIRSQLWGLFNSRVTCEYIQLSNIENIPRENIEQESPVYTQVDCFEKLGAEAEHGTSSWRVQPDECSLADEQTKKFILRSPGSKIPLVDICNN